jgi:hypothetical protein
MSRLQLQRGAVTANSLVQFLLALQHAAKVEVCVRTGPIGTQHAAEAGFGFCQLVLVVPHSAQNAAHFIVIRS